MNEAKNGTTTYIGTATKTGDGKSITHRKGIIDFVRDQGSYELESTSRAAGFDADNDGIADAWEQANGGNLTANGYDLDTKKHYTNIEVYANSLVQDIMLAGNADADDAVSEYYPAYFKEDGTLVAAIDPATAIGNQPTAVPCSGARYNLSGQRVDNGYRGLIIENGKKRLVKQ
jgi:hypothetical protein